MPTVVIVDDDAGFRGAARELLEELGLTVVAEAHDEASALAAVRAHQPDGALLDVNLPDTTGPALARELLAERPGLRILLTSTDDARGGTEGVADFLPKTELAISDLGAYFAS